MIAGNHCNLYSCLLCEKMKSYKKITFLHYLAIVAVLSCQFYCSTGGFNETSEENILNQNGEKILSRKRRYLVFPEGSSFQMGKSKMCLIKMKLSFVKNKVQNSIISVNKAFGWKIIFQDYVWTSVCPFENLSKIIWWNINLS